MKRNSIFHATYTVSTVGRVCVRNNVKLFDHMLRANDIKRCLNLVLKQRSRENDF